MYPMPDELRANLEELRRSVGIVSVVKSGSELLAAYRCHQPPQVLTPVQALAYAQVRMPATWAVLTEIFTQLESRRPGLLQALGTVLDLGAGPGTGAWALQYLDGRARHYSLLEREKAMRDVGQKIGAPPGATYGWLPQSLGEIALPDDAFRVDLVLASYCLNELRDMDFVGTVKRLIQWSRGLVLVVEPGTPRGAARIVRVRELMLEQGLELVAPCPHDGACPLGASEDRADGFCHFSVRVARSAVMRQIKGGTASFEVEPFSYVAGLQKGFVGSAFQGGMRVLDTPHLSKVEARFRVCADDGEVREVRVASRDKEAFRAVRRLRRGDHWTGKGAGEE
jgi:ribosomal protein RSM22 (predicted rRNA methylase)